MERHADICDRREQAVAAQRQAVTRLFWNRRGGEHVTDGARLPAVRYIRPPRELDLIFKVYNAANQGHP